ncbi:MAG TPA: ABC transporter ATP-binding protein [Gammaproteobacteria bacterium]|nr:ABC transporter ATP-binding protein [Gammaproteobacteria bacterium]
MTSPGGHLSIEDVSVVFDTVTALDRISLDIKPGEAVALVGLSGAGKTTLLNTCNAMTWPTSGSVAIDGKDLSSMNTNELKMARMRIGFIHQRFSLVPNLRVIQNVVIGRLGARSLIGGARDLLYPSREVTEQVYDILKSVGIPEKIYERTDRLSGGQQQRVAIARALFQNPHILLADEPISSVDPARAEATIALMKDICVSRGLTLCVSLHNLALAKAFFPRMVALRNGRVIFDQPSDTLQPSEIEEIFSLVDESPTSIPRSPQEDGLGGRFG